MPDRLILRRAWRKLVRPLRRLIAPRRRRFELADIEGSVLVAVAHPDDEAFCSGLICALRERGTAVHLLCMTRGEGGERVDDGAGELAAVREREMEAAARELGVDRVEFMGHVDPEGDGTNLLAPDVSRQTLAEQIREVARRSGAKALITHGSSGEYWHPAHLLLHDAARSLHDLLQVWTFNAWDDAHPLGGVLNRDDPAQLSVDATPFHGRRLESLRSHASQRAVFERFAGSDLETFVSQTAREGYHLLSR